MTPVNRKMHGPRRKRQPGESPKSNDDPHEAATTTGRQ
jgi:hypothetical protein